MDCKGYQELITGAVDRELSSLEQKFLSEHLRTCTSCRSDHELESSVKTLVRDRMRAVNAPAHVLRAISEGIAHESAPKGSILAGLRGLLERPFVRPALAVALTIIIALVLVTGQSPTDVIQQSVQQYEAVASGSVQMQFASSEPAVLREFFEGRTPFPVMIPNMDDCTLLGGILDENPNGAVAEVLYDHHSHKIYLYQAGWDGVTSGSTHTLSPEVHDELLRDNTYTHHTSEGLTVVLWRKGATLCSAVSDLSSQDLKNCLTSGDPNILLNQ